MFLEHVGSLFQHVLKCFRTCWNMLVLCLIVGVFACLIVCVFVRFMVCLIDCVFDCLCIVAAQNERHAAWEALFLKKTSATLHGSAPGGTPAAQNERHAAWEALFLKKTSATLHGSAPGRQLAAPPRPRTSATQHGNHFCSKKRAPRCMGALRPLKGAQDHPRETQEKK